LLDLRGRLAMVPPMIAIPCHECGSVIWCTAYDSEESSCPHCGASKLQALYLLAAVDARAYDFFWNTLTLQELSYFRKPRYPQVGVRRRRRLR
jgi:hypothetical protein